MFPRLHPLWHKSRLDFERPEAAPPCTAYGTSEALTVEVGPGDVLYVPPLWWHTVETLSPSASLSTLSRYHALYNRMQGLYRMTYHFDKLAHYEARPYPNPIPIPNPNPNPNPHPNPHPNPTPTPSPNPNPTPSRNPNLSRSAGEAAHVRRRAPQAVVRVRVRARARDRDRAITLS